MAAAPCRSGRRLVLTAWLLASAGSPCRAQLPPSPAALAEAARPVRVVCVADRPDAFLRDEVFRDRVLARLPTALPLPAATDDASRLRALIAPSGTHFVVPVGGGFVVDPARRHVVSSWQAVSACAPGPGSGRRLGVAEADAADIAVQLAEQLPDRTYQDAAGNPVQLVQALCRDARERCGADLPRAPDDKPPAAALRRRQLDNLLAYAPDLVVLRLPQPVRTAPLALALQQQLDDQMHLVVRAFGPLPVGVGTADAAARLHLVAPLSVAAIYTGPHQISALPPAGQPGPEVHARLHRMAARIESDQSGAPVLRGSGVVGVLTALAVPAANPASAPPAYAVPVTVLAVFLDLLKVPYVTAPPDAPLRASPADPGQAAAPPVGLAGPRQLLLGGALLLALLAAAAFGLLARRRPLAAAVPPPAPAPLRPQQPAQRTSGRVGPTVLHPVALPTAAIDPPVAEAELAAAPDRPAAVAVVHLQCTAGPLAPARFTLPMPNGGTTLFVGRDAHACQVVFPAMADQVSAVHACFIWDPQQRLLTVRDLSSSGSWVNGQRIAKGRTLALSGGDRVDLGGAGLNRFTIETAQPGGPAATEMP